MTNPFNDSPHGRDGTNPEYATITTQGDHSLSAADVDGDGKHEIVYGAATIDDDGSLLYSSFDVLPAGSAAPGQTVRLGHGDAMHVTDIDPARPGIEIWTAHEGATVAPYGSAMRDAATGEVLFGAYSGRDTGRAMIGDVRSDVPGIEVWASMPGGTEASGLLSATGEILSVDDPGTEHVDPLGRRPHDADRQRRRDGTPPVHVTPTIDDWTRGNLLTATGTLTNNGTKGNPSLVADVLGDWREELLRAHRGLDGAAHLHEHRGHDAQADDAHARRAVPRRDRAPADHLQPAGVHARTTSRATWTGRTCPCCTTAVTPGEPTFKDRPGTAHDEVQVPTNVAGIAYYVNGELVTAPNGKVAVTGEATVVAVPTAWYSIAEGAPRSGAPNFDD